MYPASVVMHACRHDKISGTVPRYTQGILPRNVWYMYNHIIVSGGAFHVHIHSQEFITVRVCNSHMVIVVSYCPDGGSM